MKYNHKKVISKGRRKKEKVKNEQRYAEKAVNKEDEIQNVLQLKAETFTDLAVDAAQEQRTL